MTEAEQLLWYRLRRRQLANQRFRRQVPIGPYVVDFACLEIFLVVEVDGSQHLDAKHDQQRDAWLSAAGYRVLRFWNHDVLCRTESVLAQILDVVATTCPHPASGHLPPQAGEGKAGAQGHLPPQAREGKVAAQGHLPSPAQEGKAGAQGP